MPKSASATVAIRGIADAGAGEDVQANATNVSASNTGASGDYNDELDTIIGWSLDRTDSTVTFETKRSTDDIKRKVPEVEVQRVNESKVTGYWRSFGKERQETLGCESYRIFRILGKGIRNPSRLRIHWVGYSVGSDITEEPVANLLSSLDGDMVREYLTKGNLTAQLKKRKRDNMSTVQPSPASAPSSTSKPATAGASHPSSSKRARRHSLVASSNRRSNRWSIGAGRVDDGVDANEASENGENKTRHSQRDVKTPTPKAAKSVKPAARASSRKKTMLPPEDKPQAPAQREGLFSVELGISGIPYEDVSKLLSLAVELCAQPNAVSIQEKVTPLP